MFTDNFTHTYGFTHPQGFGVFLPIYLQIILSLLIHGGLGFSFSFIYRLFWVYLSTGVWGFPSHLFTDYSEFTYPRGFGVFLPIYLQITLSLLIHGGLGVSFSFIYRLLWVYLSTGVRGFSFPFIYINHEVNNNLIYRFIIYVCFFVNIIKQDIHM